MVLPTRARELPPFAPGWLFHCAFGVMLSNQNLPSPESQDDAFRGPRLGGSQRTDMGTRAGAGPFGGAEVARRYRARGQIRGLEGGDCMRAEMPAQCAESLDCSRTEHGSASGGE